MMSEFIKLSNKKQRNCEFSLPIISCRFECWGPNFLHVLPDYRTTNCTKVKALRIHTLGESGTQHLSSDAKVAKFARIFFMKTTIFSKSLQKRIIILE